MLDTRPKLNASVNRLMGGGSENSKYYKHMDIEFHPIVLLLPLLSLFSFLL